MHKCVSGVCLRVCLSKTGRMCEFEYMHIFHLCLIGSLHLHSSRLLSFRCLPLVFHANDCSTRLFSHLVFHPSRGGRVASVWFNRHYLPYHATDVNCGLSTQDKLSGWAQVTDIHFHLSPTVNILKRYLKSESNTESALIFHMYANAWRFKAY